MQEATRRGGPLLDDVDGSVPSPVGGGCPGCGSSRMIYGVDRSETRDPLGLEHYFVWECSDCGERWAEPIVGPAPGPVPPPGVVRRPVS